MERVTGSPRPACRFDPDEAVAPVERLPHVPRGEAARHKERAAGCLVDARRIGEPRDQGDGERVPLDLDLGAAHGGVDPELVHLAHGEGEAAAELHVRVAGGDLEAGGRVRRPELGGVDRVAKARLVVLGEDALVRRIVGGVGRVVGGAAPVEGRVEAKAGGPSPPSEGRVDAVDPFAPAAVLDGRRAGDGSRVTGLDGQSGRRPGVEVLRDDRGLGDVELHRLGVGGAEIDRERARRDEQRDERTRDGNGASSHGGDPSQHRRGLELP